MQGKDKKTFSGISAIASPSPAHDQKGFFDYKYLKCWKLNGGGGSNTSQKSRRVSIQKRLLEIKNLTIIYFKQSAFGRQKSGVQSLLCES